MRFFVPKDFSMQSEYDKGFKIVDLMPINSTGIETQKDQVLVNFNENYLLDNFEREYGVIPDKNKVETISYRPFDYRYIYYDGNYVKRARFVVMRHFLDKDNLGIIAVRNNRDDSDTFFVCNRLVDKTIMSSKDNANVFPLYLYPENGSMETERRANLDETIWADINAAIGKKAAPEDIFDYIYGVLHSPAYRAKYKEFLKVDFPRIPYPKDAAEFEHYRGLGHELRELHLMHNVPASPVAFPEAGSMVVEQITYDGDKVHINGDQYFANVPAEAWNFYIGGYQPAQKWLKDRKGRALSFDDINHYRNIIAVLLRTAELMREIDKSYN